MLPSAVSSTVHCDPAGRSRVVLRVWCSSARWDHEVLESIPVAGDRDHDLALLAGRRAVDGLVDYQGTVGLGVSVRDGGGGGAVGRDGDGLAVAVYGDVDSASAAISGLGDLA